VRPCGQETAFTSPLFIEEKSARNSSIAHFMSAMVATVIWE
jgi:hypothetical protein